MPSTINRTLPAQNAPMLSLEMRQQFGRAADDIDALQTGKAPLAAPAFTGNPTAPTQPTTDNSTRLATTAFAKAMPITNLQGNPVTAGTPAAGSVLTWSGGGWAGAAATGGVPDPAALAFRPLPASGSLLDWITTGAVGVFYVIVPGGSPLDDRPPLRYGGDTSSLFILRGIADADYQYIRAERYPWRYATKPDEVFTRQRYRSGVNWYWNYQWELENDSRWVTTQTFPLTVAQGIIPGNWTRIPSMQQIAAANPRGYLPSGYQSRMVITATFPGGLQISNYNQSVVWGNIFPWSPNTAAYGHMVFNGSSYDADTNPDHVAWWVQYISEDFVARGPDFGLHGDLYWRASLGEWESYNWAMYVQQRVTRTPLAQDW